jgi:ketosteroid isomerase-like protein
MRRRFSIFVLAFSSFIPAVALSQTNTPDLNKTIERLHEQWFAAFDKGDGATMDRMEVPNLVLVFEDGTIWHKNGPRTGTQEPTGATSRSLSKVQIRQFGDTAILTGLLTTKDQKTEETVPTTVVWLRRDNNWLVASAQWGGKIAQNGSKAE